MFLFPTNKEIQEISPVKVARMSEDRLGFKLMPFRSVNAGIVQWTQKDNYSGLQQLRGLDGSPASVKRIGQNTYSYMPGIYGEFQTIGESELTLRAGSITTDAPIDITDLVVEGENFLLGRELDRQESIIWTLLTTGTFTITGPNGQASFTDTFALQTANRAVAWTTLATATPLVDIRAVQQLGLGKGVAFNGSSKMYMNRLTANALIGNTNAADLGGIKSEYGATITASLEKINAILLGQDLPQIEVYDEGYYNEANTFVKYIPDNKVVCVGARATAERIGEYVLTRNANNPNMAPGPYVFIVDRTKPVNGQKQVPPTVEVHRGHNGGPIIYFPGSIVILST